MSIDIFSHAIVTTARASEKTVNVIHHFQKTFSVLRMPQQIRTDNSSGYVSQKTKHLFTA